MGRLPRFRSGPAGVLSLLVGLTACGNAGEPDPLAPFVPEATPTEALDDLRVAVRDGAGRAVPGATVEVRDAASLTVLSSQAVPPTGVLDLPSLPAERPMLVGASAPQWSSNLRRVVVREHGASLVLQLQPVETVEVSASGFETADGVAVSWGADARFFDERGLAWLGPVWAEVAAILGPESLPSAPGALVARTEDGGSEALQSFGMVEVRFRSSTDALRFEGAAQLSFPLGSPADDGGTIPLWSLDEDDGRWVEEGEGSVIGGRFVATVDHFTWWNADLPRDRTSCVHGRWILPDGSPAAGHVVMLTGIDHLAFSDATLDADGAACLEGLRGGEVLLQVWDLDGATRYEWRGEHTLPDEALACDGPSPCLDLGVHTLQDTRVDDDGDGYSELGGDCDDFDSTRHPGAADTAGDGEDLDCDGLDGVDADDDQWASVLSGGTDCDDTRPDVRPGAWEHCDGVDEDCDAVLDDGAIDAQRWFLDGDGDGFGDPDRSERACEPVGTAQGLDCDDTAADHHPGAAERCGGGDEDCDLLFDEAGALGSTPWYPDQDGDGFGAEGALLLACAQPTGYVAMPGDCVDGAATAHPGGIESCNGLDDDCDGVVDGPGALGQHLYYLDGDGDGWGLTTSPVSGCLSPIGAASLAGDCDDLDPAVFPGAIESCAATDDLNCDGSTGFADLDGDGVAACFDCDDLDAARAPGAPELCDLIDADCDGILADYFSDLDGDDLPDCADDDDDGDLSPDAGDCGPLDPSTFPGAAEACDGEDTDCDGDLGDGFPDRDLDGDPDCIDDDDDGDGSPDILDCVPDDSTIFPGAEESCDGIDEDCDGLWDPCSLLAAPAMVAGNGIGTGLGSAFAVGDIDGDGDADLVSGAPGGAPGGLGSGALHITPGPLQGLVPLDPQWSGGGAMPGDLVGQSLDLCDLDGDGFDDLVVGAWGATGTAPLSGVVWVYRGPLAAAPPPGSADTTFLGSASESWAGASLRCAPDLDGDGIDDLLIGAPRHDGGLVDRGAAYVILGPRLGTHDLSTAEATWLGEASHDYAGSALSPVGDVTGDAVPDLVVGAWGQDAGGGSAGAAYILAGPFAGTSSLQAARARWVGEGGGDRAGFAVAGVGDLDGNGLPEVAIGAWAHDGPGPDSGALYAVSGLPSGLFGLGTAPHRLVGPTAGDHLGWSLVSVPDLDGDGGEELLVGAPTFDGLEPEGGAAFLLRGASWPASPLSAAGIWHGFWPAGAAGSGLWGAAELDSTPGLDLVIGAPQDDLTFGNAGVAYVVPVPSP